MKKKNLNPEFNEVYACMVPAQMMMVLILCFWKWKFAFHSQHRRFPAKTTKKIRKNPHDVIPPEVAL